MLSEVEFIRIIDRSILRQQNLEALNRSRPKARSVFQTRFILLSRSFSLRCFFSCIEEYRATAWSKFNKVHSATHVWF